MGWLGWRWLGWLGNLGSHSSLPPFLTNPRVRKKCISFVNCDVLSVALEVAIVEKREIERERYIYICPLNFNWVSSGLLEMFLGWRG
jgi:hypothetical protein